MMKRMLAGFAALLILLGMSAALAEAGEEHTCGSYRYVVLPDGTAEITGYVGREKRVTVPAELNGHAVTSIGFEAFSQTKVNHVTLPEGVTTIGPRAFRRCASLNSIVLPEGLRVIGDDAFNDCEYLSSIILPDSLIEIGESAFRDCKNLRGIVIPEGITCLVNFTVHGCSKLSSVHLPASLEWMGIDVFNGCERLRSIVIPDHVRSIGAMAFFLCTELESVYIPESVVSLGKSAFYGCLDVTVYCVEDSAVAEKMAEEGVRHAFVTPEEQEMRRLTQQPNADGSVSVTGYTGSSTEITIPAQLDMRAVTAVAPAGFSGQTGLTTIVISDGVTAIGEYAFLGCPTLKTLVIPASVTEIGTGVGLYSPALTLTVSEGSAGHEYAVANGLPFVLVD